MVAWNEQFPALVGLSDEFLRGRRDFPDFIRFLAKKGDYGSVDVETQVREHLASVDQRYVGERIRADGASLEIQRNPVPGGGFISMYTDVTERRRAQALVEQARARLADAIESISDGFALWDQDDRLVLFNKRSQEILNLHDLFVAGVRFEDLIQPLVQHAYYDPSTGDSRAWFEKRLALHRNAPSVHEQKLADGTWLRVGERRTQRAGRSRPGPTSRRSNSARPSSPRWSGTSKPPATRRWRVPRRRSSRCAACCAPADIS
jgi:PAS domain-containing protein